MRLDAALRTAHCRGGFCHVEFFPITQQKRLTLTRREARQGLLDDRHDLPLLQLSGGVCSGVRVGPRRQSFQEVEIVILAVLLPKRREKRRPGGTDFLAPEMIMDRVLQDALKQLRQFTGTKLPAEAWIDEQGLLRKLTLGFTLARTPDGPFRMSFTEELYDFGAAVHVQAPPASQVTDATKLLGRSAPSSEGR